MVSVRIICSTLFASVFCLAPLCAQAPTIARNFSPSASTPPAPVSPAPQLSPEVRGDVFMARKMFREAIEAYQEGPKNSAVLLNKIGIAWHQLGDLNAAKKSYERSIRADHKFADAVNNLGTIYYARRNYRGAISRYRKAIRLDPDVASFWSNLGTGYYSRGKFVDMTKAYEHALELDPLVFERHGTTGAEMQDRTVADRARYHFELARMYAHAGKNELAFRYLRKSLEEGFKDKSKLREAPEFAAIRDTDEFKELLALQPKIL